MQCPDIINTNFYFAVIQKSERPRGVLVPRPGLHQRHEQTGGCRALGIYYLLMVCVDI